MEIKIITSGDGSHTLFLPHLNETYHSNHGALAESLYVFIEKGLLHIAEKENSITILEVGLGTGLNALLTQLATSENNIVADYHTLEPFPLPKEVYQNLNYSEITGSKKEDLVKIHESEWNLKTQLQPGFFFTRYKTTLQEFQTNTEFNLIYFDAFAPNKQPEVWSQENLRKCFELLVSGGVLVTYCAQGQFKRDLKAAGFIVENLPGPPGKKEMTRAVKL